MNVNAEGKKVFLLNTHLDNIINNPKGLCIQLEDIIREFRKRDNAVLLWRPHPLSLSTFHSMQENFARRYEKIVDEFRHMNQGILDESSDWGTAVAVSDAYIGDYSSMVPLYLFTGKPLLIMEPLSDYHARGTVQFIAGAVYEGWIYFSSVYFNGLFKMNISTNQMIFLGIFEKETADHDLHMKAVIWKNSVWFIPKAGSYITKVNLETNSKEYFPSDQFNGGGLGHQFINAVQEENYLWLIPAYSGNILKLDLESGNIRSFEIQTTHVSLSSRSFNFYGAGIYKKNLILCPYGADRVVVLNMSDGTFKSYPWNFPEKAFASMCVVKDELWFIPRWYDKIVRYNVKTGKWNHIDLPGQICGYDEKFITSYYDSKNIWLIPSHAGAILKINTDTISTELITGYEDQIFNYWQLRKKGDFINVVSTKNTIFLTSFYGRGLYSLDISSGRKGYLSLSYSEEEIYRLKERGRKTCQQNAGGSCIQYMENSNFCSVARFIDNVMHCDDKRAEQRRSRCEKVAVHAGDCGKMIWDMLIKKIHC